jgi:hypothetical protein
VSDRPSERQIHPSCLPRCSPSSDQLSGGLLVGPFEQVSGSLDPGGLPGEERMEQGDGRAGQPGQAASPVLDRAA